MLLHQAGIRLWTHCKVTWLAVYRVRTLCQMILFESDYFKVLVVVACAYFSILVPFFYFCTGCVGKIYGVIFRQQGRVVRLTKDIIIVAPKYVGYIEFEDILEE